MKKKKKYNKINRKLQIIPAIIVVIVLIAITIGIDRTSSDGLKYNKNKSFTKNQEVEGILFSNIKCAYDGNDSLISYTMVNGTSKKIYLDNYDIIVKDKKNVKLTKIAAHITQTLEPNETIEMANQVVGIDLTDAKYMELILDTNNKKEKNSDK